MQKKRGNLERVHVGADPLIAGHIETIFNARGIHCMVRNRHLVGGAGEIPPLEAWPEVWVAREDADIARQLIREILDPEGPVPADWRCPDCGEVIEGQFAECWSCGALAP
ncbi:DUF2007 domain-containing protein [Spiribacter sp. 2438]|uniref:putative signal transducing protein n=1 Tax=Spiribacter sp. 2438 TaxID=2666185 RepID=UPI0012AF0D16|nr:DUF2007 domain-containing protein [Spiribacter sp. 2438]QGM21197.1 DUF2007 domain-containing protein [Spiribacter sp. 2438]